MSRPVGWGVVGASTIAAEYMIPAMREHAESEPVGVLSSDEERGRRFAKEHGLARSYTDLSDLLADPEVNAVYVSTTNELHASQVRSAAAAGKHVLCEKPLATTLEGARGMLSACLNDGVVLGTNHHLRNAATHRTMRRLVAEGAIGRPLAARVLHAVLLPEHLRGWRIQRPDAGGGVVLDITVHDADTLRFVLDDEPEEVVAMTANQGLAQPDLEDAVMGTIRFAGGVLASFHDSFMVPASGTGFEVHGDGGSLVGRDVMTQQPVGEVVLRRDGVEEVVDVGQREDLYFVGVRAFVDAVLGRGSPAASGEDGVRSLALAIAVVESAETGRACRVAIP